MSLCRTETVIPEVKYLCAMDDDPAMWGCKSQKGCSALGGFFSVDVFALRSFLPAEECASAWPQGLKSKGEGGGGVHKGLSSICDGGHLCIMGSREEEKRPKELRAFPHFPSCTMQRFTSVPCTWSHCKLKKKCWKTETLIAGETLTAGENCNQLVTLRASVVACCCSSFRCG